MNKRLSLTIAAVSMAISSVIAANGSLLVVPARPNLVDLEFDLLECLPKQLNIGCYKGESAIDRIEIFDKNAKVWKTVTTEAWESGAYGADKLVLAGQSKAAKELGNKCKWANEVKKPSDHSILDIIKAVDSFEPLSVKQWDRLSKKLDFTITKVKKPSRYDRAEEHKAAIRQEQTPVREAFVPVAAEKTAPAPKSQEKAEKKRVKNADQTLASPFEGSKVEQTSAKEDAAKLKAAEASAKAEKSAKSAEKRQTITLQADSTELKAGEIKTITVPEAKQTKAKTPKAKVEAKKPEAKVEAKPAEIKVEAKPADVKPVEVKAPEAKKPEVKVEAKPAEIKVETKPADVKPVEVKEPEAKKPEVKVEAKPAEIKVETKPADVKPVEVKAPEAKKPEVKVEAKPAEIKVETKPADVKPVEVKAPEVKKPEVKVEAKPAEIKVETKPADVKPVEVKAPEIKVEAKPKEDKVPEIKPPAIVLEPINE